MFIPTYLSTTLARRRRDEDWAAGWATRRWRRRNSNLLAADSAYHRFIIGQLESLSLPDPMNARKMFTRFARFCVWALNMLEFIWIRSSSFGLQSYGTLALQCMHSWTEKEHSIEKTDRIKQRVGLALIDSTKSTFDIPMEWNFVHPWGLMEFKHSSTLLQGQSMLRRFQPCNSN